MSDYITTYTGKHVEPLNPDEELICIEDIAHALSLLCRGNGHVKNFFSVGQHCINCAREGDARGFSPRLVLACLLHDAAECYLSDVPRPFKKKISDYEEWETRLLSMICKKFLGSSLSKEEEEQVKEIDDAMLWYDLKYLLGEVQTAEAPGIHIELSYDVRPFAEVEAEYLALFRGYCEKGR